MNLVSNAVKFTERGGVHIRFSVGAPEDGLAEGPRLGPGQRDRIDPARQARIFSPFTQADMSTTRKYGGTGLGPLDLQEARRPDVPAGIWVESVPGNGSTFCFTLKLRVG